MKKNGMINAAKASLNAARPAQHNGYASANGLIELDRATGGVTVEITAK